ncbi:MAG: hypothetical protein MPK62_14090, partial [Alphaproteobacteria bacterium]|nr:hypothetical protein [Alphaproteobacteria bacterium]
MGAAIGAVAGGIGSLFGGRARRREEREARAAVRSSERQLNQFQFTNPYANLENTAEDLTINQRATQVAAQQRDRAFAQGLDSICL